MTVLRLDSFTIDPADTGELLTRHSALGLTRQRAGRRPPAHQPRGRGRLPTHQSLAVEFAEVLDA